MSVQEISSSLLSSKKADNSEILRPRATYHPSIWGDRFLNYNPEYDLRGDEIKKRKIEEVKEVVRKEVFTKAAKADPCKQLRLIDAVQRLGLSYHFEREMEEALQHIYHTYHGHDEEQLYDAALRFRLLRQHGYYVSCDIFNKFKEEGSTKFKECLVSDVDVMCSLYEASHLSLHGEDMLDEALVFTTTHLEYVATQGNHPLSAEITCILKRPLRKSLERLQARHYISIYENDASHNKPLLELAKLDFNLVQSLHKNELCQISRWWKDLNIENRLPFARDRIVELYFWVMGVYFEPKYSLGRKFLTKVIALTSLIDDAYDAYGTFEELELFTEAIQRWDADCPKHLPEYMQLIYQMLLDVYGEVEVELEEEERYTVHYAKEAMKIVTRSYFEEAIWLQKREIPTLEEYLRVSTVSCGYPMLTTASFVGMRESNIVTKDVFEWMRNDPKIVRASTIICRLMDDIVSHKFEQKRDHVPSAVECYIKQHEVSEQEASDEFNKQVNNAWKDINQEFLRPTPVPMPILMRVINLARVMDLLYKDDDGYTNVGKVVKDAVAALLIDPVPI